MKLSLDSSRSIAAWLFKLYCFASNPTFSSRLLKYKWFYKSNDDIFFRKDGKAPNNCDRHNRYELEKFHPRLSDGYDTEKSEWLDSFADYIKKLNKPVKSLTGIIPVNNFNSIDELVSRQEKLAKTILTKYFKRENSNYG